VEGPPKVTKTLSLNEIQQGSDLLAGGGEKKYPLPEQILKQKTLFSMYSSQSSFAFFNFRKLIH